MQNHIKKYLKEALFFVVFLTIAMNVVSYYRASDLNKNRLDIKHVTLIDGRNITLPKNRPIMIHFWATWCPICKLEAPNIEKISKDYDVITIAVQSGTQKEIQAYLDEHKLHFNVVNDKEGFYAKKFHITVFPTTLMYDKEGRLKFSEVGYTTTAGLYARMLMSQ
ncbi:redoxin domain-containing protein [Sulfurospirillum sp. 1612]|uniref:redoxin domain-containing protein n=1 Tax=Sulfurospirillum sp. 1612 TaxID=3094835 RepID=UPI002F9314B7